MPFNVNTDKQRLDSVHIKSNMRRLSRIGIFAESIHKFLVKLLTQTGNAPRTAILISDFIADYLEKIV